MPSFFLQTEDVPNGNENPVTFDFPTPVEITTFTIRVTPLVENTPVTVSELQVKACVKPTESKWIVLKIYIYVFETCTTLIFYEESI